MEINNHTSRGERLLEQIIRSLIAIILVAMPLIFLTFRPVAVFFPYTFPKAILFQALTQIMAAAWIILAFRNPRFRPRLRHPVVFGSILFLIFITISQLWSIDFSISLWSTQNRMTGLLHYAHVVVWFVVLHSCIRTREDWRRLGTLTCSTAAVVAAIGVIQWFTNGFRQIESTLGNAVHLATYLLINIFFALWRYHEARTQKEKRIFLGIFCFILLALLLTGSRSTVIGLAVGLLFLGISKWMQTRRLRGSSSRRKLVWIAAAVVAVLVLSVTLSRTGSFTHLFSTKTGDRLGLWQIGVRAWQERPLTGWGFEQFSVPFNRLRDPRVYPAITDLWDDRAHNVFIDTLVSSGLIGLVGLLLLWGLVIFALEKYRRHPGRSPEERNQLFIITALLAAYVTNWLFQVEQVTSTMLIFFTFAHITYITQSVVAPRGPEVSGHGSPRVRVAVLAVPVFLALFPLFYMSNLRPLMADMRHVRAMRVVQTDIPQGRARFEAIFSSWHPYEHEMRTHIAGVIFKMAPALVTPQKNESHALLLFVEAELQKSLRAHPEDLKTAISAAWIAQSLLVYEPEALDRLLEYANHALSRAPYFSEAHAARAAHAVLEGDFKTALDRYEQAEAYAFTSIQKMNVASMKANVLAVLGRWEDALAELHKLSDSGQPIGGLFLTSVSRGVEVNPELPKELIALTLKFVNSAPTTVSVLSAAVIIFHNAKEYDARDAILEQMKRIDSSAAGALRKRLSL